MTAMTLSVLAAAQQQAPQDVGKAGPFGLLLLVLLLIASALLVKSMTGHLKRLPRSFDEADRVVVPDSPAGLDEDREPGQELLDTLRRAPLAIEPPRREDGDRR
ncbi:hypothetical protein ACI79P_01925 [Blastococcus sp. SYSU DS0510]